MDLSNVRIREHFGLVSNDTHTGQFCFLISPPKNRNSVEKHDYVLFDHPLFGEACQALAVITEVTSYEEIAGSTMGDKMGKMLAAVEVIGYIDLRNENKPFCKMLVPPNPGSRIYIPLKKFLEDILNRNLKGEPFKVPIEIGAFEGSSAEAQENNGFVKCFVDAQDFTSTHTIITGMVGVGKTYIAKLLVKEMFGKTSKQIVVFDPYDEYSSVLDTAAKINELTPKMDKENLAKEIKKGQMTILSAHGLSLEERQAYFTETLRTLLKLRSEGKIKPLFLIIEEAENINGSSLEEVVAEGRKTGIFLCLLTTHPSELRGKILSQIGNQIIGKTTDKEDIEYLANMAGTTNALPSLAFGEWIISGINSIRPTKIRIK